MRVYILTRDVAYEGSDILGIYASAVSASLAAEARAQLFGITLRPPFVEEGVIIFYPEGEGHEEGEDWYERLVVREYEVKA